MYTLFQKSMQLRLTIIGRAPQVCRASQTSRMSPIARTARRSQAAAPFVEVHDADSRLSDLKRAIEAAEGIPEVLLLSLPFSVPLDDWGIGVTVQKRFAPGLFFHRRASGCFLMGSS